MDLLLRRRWYTESTTIGELTCGGFSCFTLEDRVRAPGVKVWGETAIPAGRYKVVLTYSNRFKRIMPLLLDVPLFTGIRMHGGNRAKDTEGCIIVATKRGEDMVWDCAPALSRLFELIQEARETWITITDEPLTDTREAA